MELDICLEKIQTASKNSGIYHEINLVWMLDYRFLIDLIFFTGYLIDEFNRRKNVSQCLVMSGIRSFYQSPLNSYLRLLGGACWVLFFLVYLSPCTIGPVLEYLFSPIIFVCF